MFHAISELLFLIISYTCAHVYVFVKAFSRLQVVYSWYPLISRQRIRTTNSQTHYILGLTYTHQTFRTGTKPSLKLFHWYGEILLNYKRRAYCSQTIYRYNKANSVLVETLCNQRCLNVANKEHLCIGRGVQQSDTKLNLTTVMHKHSAHLCSARV